MASSAAPRTRAEILLRDVSVVEAYEDEPGMARRRLEALLDCECELLVYRGFCFARDWSEKQAMKTRAPSRTALRIFAFHASPGPRSLRSRQ